MVFTFFVLVVLIVPSVIVWVLVGRCKSQKRGQENNELGELHIELLSNRDANVQRNAARGSDLLNLLNEASLEKEEEPLSISIWTGHAAHSLE